MDYHKITDFFQEKSIVVTYEGIVPSFDINNKEFASHAFVATTPDNKLYEYLFIDIKKKTNLTKEMMDWADQLENILNAIG